MSEQPPTFANTFRRLFLIKPPPNPPPRPLSQETTTKRSRRPPSRPLPPIPTLPAAKSPQPPTPALTNTPSPVTPASIPPASPGLLAKSSWEQVLLLGGAALARVSPNYADELRLQRATSSDLMKEMRNIIRFTEVAYRGLLRAREELCDRMNAPPTPKTPPSSRSSPVHETVTERLKDMLEQERAEANERAKQRKIEKREIVEGLTRTEDVTAAVFKRLHEVKQVLTYGDENRVKMEVLTSKARMLGLCTDQALGRLGQGEMRLSEDAVGLGNENAEDEEPRQPDTTVHTQDHDDAKDGKEEEAVNERHYHCAKCGTCFQNLEDIEEDGYQDERGRRV